MRGGWVAGVGVWAAACGGAVAPGGAASPPVGAEEAAPLQGGCVHGEDAIVPAERWLEPFGAAAGDALLPAVGDFVGTVAFEEEAVPLRLTLDIGQAELHFQDGWWEGPGLDGDAASCGPTLRVAVAADIDAEPWLQTQFVGELILLPGTAALATEVPGAAVAGEGMGGDPQGVLTVAAGLEDEGWTGAFSSTDAGRGSPLVADFWTRRVADEP